MPDDPEILRTREKASAASKTSKRKEPFGSLKTLFTRGDHRQRGSPEVETDCVELEILGSESDTPREQGSVPASPHIPQTKGLLPGFLKNISNRPQPVPRRQTGCVQMQIADNGSDTPIEQEQVSTTSHIPKTKMTGFSEKNSTQGGNERQPGPLKYQLNSAGWGSVDKDSNTSREQEKFPPTANAAESTSFVKKSPETGDEEQVTPKIQTDTVEWNTANTAQDDTPAQLTMHTAQPEWDGHDEKWSEHDREGRASSVCSHNDESEHDKESRASSVCSHNDESEHDKESRASSVCSHNDDGISTEIFVEYMRNVENEEDEDEDEDEETESDHFEVKDKQDPY